MSKGANPTSQSWTDEFRAGLEARDWSLAWESKGKNEQPRTQWLTAAYALESTWAANRLSQIKQDQREFDLHGIHRHIDEDYQSLRRCKQGGSGPSPHATKFEHTDRCHHSGRISRREEFRAHRWIARRRHMLRHAQEQEIAWERALNGDLIAQLDPVRDSDPSTQRNGKGPQQAGHEGIGSLIETAAAYSVWRARRPWLGTWWQTHIQPEVSPAPQKSPTHR